MDSGFKTLTKFALSALLAATVQGVAANAESIAKGKFLIGVGGCNDCHTPGYSESGGRLPQATWLTGNGVGFKGPWGTSYPQNLRSSAAKMSAEEWIQMARRPMLPPMPAPAIATMSDSDLIAMYDFIKSLGAAEGEAPHALPPGVEPATPYIDFVPKNL
ncbi:c-type cytochrome [Halioxenophilus sp. WMMB6]|uniref:c-type cytochrome n=1 Tax=Halioxenophilus sp. WMMB6 TaxID=3073815 RepID=UPI00295F0924|nr:c-type cytochrome [Halioxenophilus sp. WMMB6]